MYSIKVGEEELFYPGDALCCITSGKLIESLNDAGSLEITLPSVNPYYDRLRQRHTELTVCRNNEVMWNGEVREISNDFYNNKTVYCVGEMAYLNDSVQPLKEYKHMTKVQIFEAIINEHNSQVEDRKRFEVGALGINDAGAFFTMVTNWDGTLDFIRENICGEDDCIRIRRFDGKRYIDVMPLESYGTRSEQYIEFGDNLLDYTSSTDSSELYTAVIPLGEALEETPIEDYDNYLTITSVNGGKNYVYSQTAVDNFGWIKAVVNFDGITDAEELKAKAEEWLISNQYEKFSYNLNAIDMSLLDRTIDDYAVGDYIRCISEPHAMDVWVPVRKRQIDLLSLKNNKITLGAAVQKSFTKKTAESYTELKDKMPEEQSILNSAKKNASALINANGTGGCVSMRIDSNGKPYEIDIMNADSLEQSTKVWRWNLNGLGYGTKEIGDVDVTWNADLAITMDGQIVANYITAGILSGIEINNGNGTFKVDSKGNLTATNASISGSINSSTGHIAGWDIRSGDLRYGSGSDCRYLSLNGNKVLGVGAQPGDDDDDYDAFINEDGYMRCKNIYISDANGWITDLIDD